VTPRRLSELERGERRRAWLRTGAVLVLVWAVLFTVYYLAPPGLVPAHHRGADAFLRLGLGTALFAAILAWQARRIVGAELPELRAVEALGVVIPLFLADADHRRRVGQDPGATSIGTPSGATRQEGQPCFCLTWS
jgi:voltage-gated potassium channel